MLFAQFLLHVDGDQIATPPQRFLAPHKVDRLVMRGRHQPGSETAPRRVVSIGTLPERDEYFLHDVFGVRSVGRDAESDGVDGPVETVVHLAERVGITADERLLRAGRRIGRPQAVLRRQLPALRASSHGVFVSTWSSGSSSRRSVRPERIDPPRSKCHANRAVSLPAARPDRVRGPTVVESCVPIVRNRRQIPQSFRRTAASHCDAHYPRART